MRWFSYDTSEHVEREQLSCHLTRTTAATHAILRDNLHETPVYGGWVDAKGPRCVVGGVERGVDAKVRGGRGGKRGRCQGAWWEGWKEG